MILLEADRALDVDEVDAMVGQARSALDQIEAVSDSVESIPDRPREIIESALQDIRPKLIRIPTGPTDSRYAGGPDGLDRQMVKEAANRVEELVSMVTLQKEELIEKLGRELAELLVQLPRLEKMTKSVNQQMPRGQEGFDFAGDALKPMRAKLYLIKMMHGEEATRQVVQMALQDFDHDIPLDPDFFWAFSGTFGCKKETGTESEEFKAYKERGEMTEEEFERVTLAEPSSGDLLEACMVVQNEGFQLPDDDQFIHTLAKLIAVFKDEGGKKKHPKWLMPETYILLGQIDTPRPELN